MQSKPGSAGRTATMLVLAALILIVCAAVYLFVARPARLPAPTDGVSTTEEAARLVAEARRAALLLTILLISALLILLYVLGAYLVIRIGQMVARHQIGGRPTHYVDAWAQYRLTDEQISAATSEDSDGPGRRRRPPETPDLTEPDEPPPQEG